MPEREPALVPNATNNLSAGLLSGRTETATAGCFDP